MRAQHVTTFRRARTSSSATQRLTVVHPLGVAHGEARSVSANAGGGNCGLASGWLDWGALDACNRAYDLILLPSVLAGLAHTMCLFGSRCGAQLLISRPSPQEAQRFVAWWRDRHLRHEDGTSGNGLHDERCSQDRV